MFAFSKSCCIVWFSPCKVAKRLHTMPRRDLLTIVSYILDFLVPRCFGLLSLRFNSDTEQFQSSHFWLIVCNLWGLVFIGIYPFAAIRIITNRPPLDNEDNTIGQLMFRLHFVMTYVMSASVFIRQMLFSKHIMHSTNRLKRLCRQCETLSEEKMDVGEFIYSFIVRAFYSYSGFAAINCLALMIYFGDLSKVHLFYKIVYFMPNIVITTATISFHSGLMQLTICGRRLNREFKRCIKNINAAHNKPTTEFEQVCASTMRRFDYLTTFHGEWCEIAHMVEKGLSLPMLLIVISTIFNLTTTVNSK